MENTNCSENTQNQNTEDKWTEIPERPVYVVICTFKGTELGIPFGLDLSLGDKVVVVESCGQWMRGYMQEKSGSHFKQAGIFPVTYVKLPECKSNANDDDRDRHSLFNEGKVVASNWSDKWRTTYKEGELMRYQYEVIYRALAELIELENSIINSTLPQDEQKELKLKLAHKMGWGNRRFGFDLIPRDGYKKVDPIKVGAVELYRRHIQTIKNAETIRASCTLRKRRESSVKININNRTIGHHLLMSLRYFSYPLNDDCEIYFSLFEGNHNKFITERFMVKFKHEGFSNFVDKLQSQGLTIFEDLGYSDLMKDLYLVVQVVRIGKMSYSESTSSKKSFQLYKRPFATGVLNISSIVNSNALFDIGGTESIFEPAANESSSDGTINTRGEIMMSAHNDSLLEEDPELSFKLYQCDEKDFWQLHELLIRKQMSKVSLVSGPNYSVAVTVKLLSGSIEKIRTENPSITNKLNQITKKLGFPDVIMPNDVRNDLYLILESGEFEKSGKTHGKNIEVTISTFDTSFPMDDGCNDFVDKEKTAIITSAPYIHAGNGTGGVEEYQSVVFYHNNNPKWNETIRLSVPIEKFSTTHVRVEYRHCSTKDKNEKKLFGFSYFKLDEEGTAIKDGSHELCVYKCDDKNKLRDPNSYLSLPSLTTANLGSSNSSSSILSNSSTGSGSNVIGNQLFQRNVRESLNICTRLVSTKYTQNVDLMSLLKWKSSEMKHLRSTLDKVAALSGEEIVKYLRDILDALFAMFLSENGESNEISGCAFIVLMNIFALIENAKYEHFKPVLDNYIEKHFAAALVYKGLVTSVLYCADIIHRAPKEKYPKVVKCFETVEYTFKFVIQSHKLFTMATGGQYNNSLPEVVKSLFEKFADMFNYYHESETPAFCETNFSSVQMSMLDNLSKIYTQLHGVIPSLELTKHLVFLFSSIGLKDRIDSMHTHKLKAILSLVQSGLFKEKECRTFLLPQICRHLSHHLANRMDLPECTAILNEILTLFRHQMPCEVHADVEIIASSTLDILIQCIAALEKNIPIVVNLVTCLVELLEHLDQLHFNRLWDDISDLKQLKNFLARMLTLLCDLIKYDIYERDWVGMKLLTSSVILKTLSQLSQPLTSNFMNNCFDLDLWKKYFNLAVEFVIQPGLQLEKFNETKNTEIRTTFGDMRVKMCHEVVTMWNNLGEHQIMFIPDLVQAFLEMTLVPEEELRYASIGLFYDMLAMEEKFYGSFKQVESELIDKLDLLISQHKGDDKYGLLFKEILLRRLEDRNPDWKEAGVNFINSVTKLLARLLDFRNVGEGESNHDKKVFCIVNLLHFYQTEINRPEIYLRYLYKLHNLHIEADDYIEAGFTLLLHSQMLTWNITTDEKLPAEYIYKAQAELERKETIYLKIIEYFDKGKLWENGLPLCKELANVYENILFDYTKLSKMLRTQATFFENILTKHREKNNFYCIKFFEHNFPSYVRGKTFIFCGRGMVPLGDICQRISDEWPNVKFSHDLKGADPVDHQVVQVSPVLPIRDNNISAFQRPGIKENIQAYYEVNNITKFKCKRGFTRKPVGVVDDKNEFKYLHLEVTTLRTAVVAPGIMRFIEVADTEIEVLHPIQTACESMETVKNNLKKVTDDFKTSSDPARYFLNFTAALRGVLHSHEQGGIPKYFEAFFSSEFTSKADNSTLRHLSQLYSIIGDQLSLVEQVLPLHEKFVPPDLLDLHREFEQNLNELQNQFKACKPLLNAVVKEMPGTNNVQLLRSDSQRDSFRKGSNVSSIVHTPLPPVPKTVKKLGGVDQNSCQSNRSSSSSGYGTYGTSSYIEEPNAVHLKINPLIQSEDEDEDFYAKPDESKVHQVIPQFQNGHNSVNGRSSVPNEASAPPIPNRSTKRQVSLSNLTDVKYDNTSNSIPTEYILMPPSRIRELSSQLNDSFNDSFYSCNGSPLVPTDAPPLPPKLSNNASSSSPPPQLPKRMPKIDKNPLTPMNSLSSRSSGSSIANGYAQFPCRVTPPPVPQKPKPRPSSSGSQNNSTVDITGNADGEDYQDLPSSPSYVVVSTSPMTPMSPSYEEKFEQNSVMLTNSDSKGPFKYAAKSEVAEEAGQQVDNNDMSELNPNTNNTNSDKSIPSPNICSKNIERRPTNKEYYELPLLIKTKANITTATATNVTTAPLRLQTAESTTSTSETVATTNTTESTSTQADNADSTK